jgi:hypothetical protein
MLGMGIGLGTIDVQEEARPAEGLGTGAAIWYLLSSLIALFIAGWVSGRLAQTRRIFDGALHGILTWCLVTLVSVYFLTSTVGSIIGGAGRIVGNTLGTIGQASGNVIQSAAPVISDQVDIDLTELRNNGTTQEVIQMLRNANGDPSRIDRNQLTNVIMTQTNKSRPEAERNADDLINRYQQMSAQYQLKKQQLQEKGAAAADDIAATASKTFILAFFALLIGAGAAAYGAKMGTESKFNPYFERRRSLRHA